MLSAAKQGVEAAIAWSEATLQIAAQERNRTILLFFAVACGGSVVLRFVDQCLFDDEDAVVSEVCALVAFLAGALIVTQRRKRGPGLPPKARPGKGLAASLAAVDGAQHAQRRPRKGAGGVGGRPGWAGGGAEATEQGATHLVMVDAELVQTIAEACRSGATDLAQSSLVRLLAEKTLRPPSPPGGDRWDGEASAAIRSDVAAHTLAEACLQSGDAQMAGDWLRRFQAGGFRLSPKTILAVLDALSSGCRRDSEEATRTEQLLADLVDGNASPDVACYQLLFERCIAASDSAQINSWLERLAKRSRHELTQGYVALIRARWHTRDVSQAEAWMGRALEAGALQCTVLYNAVIHACARTGDIERAAHWLERMLEAAEALQDEGRGSCRGGEPRPVPDVISYSAIMDACAQKGETQLAERWFNRMVDAGICPDTVTYNTVIKAHARASDLGGAERWLNNARGRGVRLDAFGYNAVIAAAARAADPDRAERWLRQMIQDRAEPDVVSYNSVINAWAKCGDGSGAERIVSLMCQNNVEPDVVTLGVAVHACARAGDKDRAEMLFERIASRGQAVPDAICYNALINAAVKAGDVAKAEGWLQAMLDRGVAPSVVSYTTVLHAHAREGNIEAAERGLELMREKGVEANVVSYSALIHACVKAGDVDRAEKWFEQMRSHGIKANAVSYSVVLNVCAKACNFARAEHWLQAMASDGVAPNVVCFNNVIDACAKAGRADRAEIWLRRLMGEDVELLEDMPRVITPGGLVPTRQSYTTTAQAHASHGNWEDVERILADMEARGTCMDEYSLTVLLSAYSRSRPRQRERAEDAFKRYVDRGLKLTRPPLRVLRSTVGGARFERLMSEMGLSIPPGEGAF